MLNHKSERALAYLGYALMATGSLLLVAVITITRNGIILWP